MQLLQRLKENGYSIYKIALLLTNERGKKHMRMIQKLRRILIGTVISQKKKEEFLSYFEKIGLKHLIHDDDFITIKTENIKYKLK